MRYVQNSYEHVDSKHDDVYMYVSVVTCDLSKNTQAYTHVLYTHNTQKSLVKYTHLYTSLCFVTLLVYTW
jgi:hypothetical protein